MGCSPCAALGVERLRVIRKNQSVSIWHGMAWLVGGVVRTANAAGLVKDWPTVDNQGLSRTIHIQPLWSSACVLLQSWQLREAIGELKA